MNENLGVPASYQSVFSTPPGSLWIIPAELLTAGLLAALFVVLVVRMRGVRWLAGLVLGLALLAAVSLRHLVSFGNNEVSGYIVIGLSLFLATTLLIFIPRLVVWWGREAWWVSLGSSFVIALLLALVLLLVNVATQKLGLPYAVGYWAVYSLPFASLGLTLWSFLSRRKRLPPSS